MWGAIQSFAQMHRDVRNWQSAAEEWTVRALESIGAHSIWGNSMPLPVRAEALEAWTADYNPTKAKRDAFPFVLRHSKHDSLP